MDNAQIVSLSRQAALQRQMDVVANNLANINTTGFKAESILFADTQVPGAVDESFPVVADQPLIFTDAWATMLDMGGGAITQTGNPLDLALEGEGFFAVQTPEGDRWTRNGAFTLDSTGTLVDFDGNPVLGDAGPLRFGPDDTEITITDTGTVLTAEGIKGKLRVVEFEDPQVLSREGANLFSGGDPLTATETLVAQGAIERSNVSGVSEMAEMIRVTRAYETLAGLARQQDDIRRTAIQRLGDLSA